MDKEMEKEAKHEIKKILIGILIILIVIVGLFIPFLIPHAPPTGGDSSPLGVIQEKRTDVRLTLHVVVAHNGAMVSGSTYTLVREGIPQSLDGILLYDSSGMMIAFCDQNMTWQYVNGTSEMSLEYEEEMIIEIVCLGGFSYGGAIVISSPDNYFLRTTLKIE